MNPTEQFRLFLALAIPSEVKDRIEQAQTELKGALHSKSARWTKREQFHLTLRFLGNVETSRVEELVLSAGRTCRSSELLELVASGVGFFPNARMARVLWVGVNEQNNRLAALWKGLQSATQSFTTETEEKDFSGHITLARLNRLTRSESDHLATAAVKYKEVVFGSWTARGVELMRSELLPHGARHTVLAELPLGA